MVAAVTKQLNKNRSMDKKVTLAQLKEVVQEAYDQVKTNTGGKNADYIPYLANVNKDLFGISVCLLNGQTIHVGDTDYRFGIESVSKVHTAILALRQYGAKEILDKIGADATGLPFNSIIAILLENDHPSTPLVNAGAISACSMVKPIGDSAKKWDAIVGNVTDLCGSAPQLIDELYKSESDTNFNNRAGVSFHVQALDSKTVARYAIDGALHGKTILVPGLLMKLSLFGARLVPQKLLAAVTYHIQEQKQKP